MSQPKLYTLQSRFKCFVDEAPTFDSVSAAVEHANFIGLPQEEFDIFDEQGIRMAGIVTADNVADFL